jgi:hypothetical protein
MDDWFNEGFQPSGGFASKAMVSEKKMVTQGELGQTRTTTRDGTSKAQTCSQTRRIGGKGVTYVQQTDEDGVLSREGPQLVGMTRTDLEAFNHEWQRKNTGKAVLTLMPPSEAF